MNKLLSLPITIFGNINKFKIKLIIRILELRGLTIGKNCKILNGVMIDFGHCNLIEIGNNVTIAPRAHILAHDASTKLHMGFAYIGKVHISDNVFIGAGSIILPNVKIGANSIIGAGSVVTKDIPCNVIAAGNPARIISPLDQYLAKHKNQMRVMPCFSEDYSLRKNVNKDMKDEMTCKMNFNQGYIK